MKKRILTIILAVLLIAALFCVSAFADGDVAEVNGQGYPSFGAALAAAGDEGTVKLLQDATASGASQTTVAAGKDITIDLGGKTLTLTGSRNMTLNGNRYSLAFYNIGTLTVKNGTIALGGSSSANVAILNVGTLNIESDAVIVGTAGGYAVTNVGGTVNSAGTIRNDTTNGTALSTNGGTVNITGGTVEARDAISVFNLAYNNESAGAEVNISGGYIHAAYQCVGTNNQRSGGETPSNVTITGGELVSDKHTAIYWPSAGTLTVGVPGGDDDDVIITGENGSGILACSGTLVINSGTISGTAEEIGTDELLGLMRGNSGCANIGDAVSIVSRRSSGYTDTPLSVSVSGGSFSSTGNYALRYFDCNLAPGASEMEQAAALIVSGGVYDGTLGAVDLEYVPKGEEKVITGGTFLSNGAADTAAAGYIKDGAALKQDDSGSIIDDPDADVVASVNDVNFTDLAKAIAYAEDGDTVEVLESCTLTETAAITKNITIEGNNHTVTAEGAALYIQADLESLTVQNLKLKGAEYEGPYGEGSNESFGPWMGIGTYNGNFGVGALTLNNVDIEGFSYGLYFGVNTTGSIPDNEINKNPVRIDADDLTVKNCYIKGAYFEKLTESTFTNCEFSNNGTDDTNVNASFKDWMCGIDLNLKNGEYKDLAFENCSFTNNGDNNGTALHIKGRDDSSSYGPVSLTGVAVTGCEFEGNNDTDKSGEPINPIIIGEPNKGNKTPTAVNIQPDVPYTNNLSTTETFTVEFEGEFADGLAVSIVAKGDEIELPVLTQSGYAFRGWRDGAGTLHAAGSTVTVTADATYTAVWTEINVPDPSAITVTQPANGTVSTNLSNASAGAAITVTATPDSGYELAYITVNGEKIDGTTFTMPDEAVTVSAVFVPATGGFTDVVPGAWYMDAVNYVVANGLMEGTSATTFEPEAQMTRAMVWTILARMDGETISGSSWSSTAREWAMVNGVSDGTDPNGLVTREQLVTMLWRYAGEPESSQSLSGYTDASSVSDWAEAAMAWAIEKGVITGMTATTLAPQATATRAQAAAILMRFAAL